MAADPGRAPNPPLEQMAQGESALMSTSGSNVAQRCCSQGAHRGQHQEQSRAPRFDGQCEEQRTGHVYNYFNPWTAVDQYMKTTTHEICKYIGRTYTYGEDMKVALETLTMRTLTESKDPSDNNVT